MLNKEILISGGLLVGAAVLSCTAWFVNRKKVSVTADVVPEPTRDEEHPAETDTQSSTVDDELTRSKDQSDSNSPLEFLRNCQKVADAIHDTIHLGRVGSQDDLSFAEKLDIVENHGGIGADGSTITMIVPPVDVESFVEQVETKTRSFIMSNNTSEQMEEVTLDGDSPTFADDVFDVVDLVNNTDGEVVAPNGFRIKRVNVIKRAKREK